MSLKVGQLRATRGRSKTMAGFLPPDHVNRLLACNFRVMKFLGDRVLRLFMQDTIRWWPLTLAMNGMALSDPIAIGRVIVQVIVWSLPSFVHGPVHSSILWKHTKLSPKPWASRSARCELWEVR